MRAIPDVKNDDEFLVDAIKEKIAQKSIDGETYYITMSLIFLPSLNKRKQRQYLS